MFLRAISPNVIVFLVVLLTAALLLRVSGDIPQANFLELALAAFHMALHERVVELREGWLDRIPGFFLTFGNHYHFR